MHKKNLFLRGLDLGLICFIPVTCINHPSVYPSNLLFHKATEQVKKEIESGNYEICKKSPMLISPMAAIPKPDGDVQLIHDCC